METLPFAQWTVQDWVAHYGPQFDPERPEPGGIWDDQGRRLPGRVHLGPDRRPRVYYAGQQSVPLRATQGIEHLAQHGQQTVQSTVHSATSLVHHGIASATSPRVLLAGIAALGIIGWVLVQQGRTVGRTVESVAPHAAKALPLLAL